MSWSLRPIQVFAPALIETERWIVVCHQRNVAEYAERPAVETDDEIEQWLRILSCEEEYHCCDEDEYAEQSSAPNRRVRIPPPPSNAAADDEDQHEKVRDGQQPPFHEHQSMRKLVRVGHFECCWVVGFGSEGERRITVCPEATCS